MSKSARKETSLAPFINGKHYDLDFSCRVDCSLQLIMHFSFEVEMDSDRFLILVEYHLVLLACAAQICVLTNDGRNIMVSQEILARMHIEIKLIGYIPRIMTYIESYGDYVQGKLCGFDQVTNLILTDCHERVYSTSVRTPLIFVV